MRIRVISCPVGSRGDPDTVTRWWAGVELEVLRFEFESEMCVVDGGAALEALGRIGSEGYQAADWYRRARSWRVAGTFEFLKGSWEEVH